MGRPTADERLRRLLAIVPWVVAQDGPTLEEVCDRFDLSEQELVAELDLVFLCGVHPFTPDTLMDVVIADGRVWIRYADYFDRPLRLTPEEGLSLVASGAALLAVPGADPAGPLARGLAKVADVLGVDAEGAIGIELGVAPAGVLEQLHEAVSSRRSVEIDYYAYGRDTRTRRVIDPHRVFTADGEWYVSAWCHLAVADRRFRVDRIRGLELLAQTFEAPVSPPTAAVYEARPDDPRVVLELSAQARWVIEQYPTEAVEEVTGGTVRVTLAASEPAWLERLLLRLGPEARIVEGAASRRTDAATRVLLRYDAG